MGWYHVNRTGKGFTIGDTRHVHFDIERLAQCMPDKELIIQRASKCFRDAPLATYDEWPVLWKFAALNRCSWWDWNEENTDTLDDRHKSIILARAISFCFEKKYGYPYGSFVSTSDYNDDIMIFCYIQWPPKKYNESLAMLTEETLEIQLKEFLMDVTDVNLVNRTLEICEEYIKE